MTKAAVAVMVKGIAVDLASRGITVNNIQPGPTVTDMTVDLSRRSSRSFRLNAPEIPTRLPVWSPTSPARSPAT